jgi:DNA-binding NarL/FixJ family response regulator
MAAGLSNGEIARALHLSMETVKTHVKHVLAKLEVRDRTQAVVWAYRTGFAYRT